MSNATQNERRVDARRAPDAHRVWARVLWIAVAVWTLAMIVSLHERFLDRFVAGASHKLIGNDFFSTPRGFQNLVAGSNIYLTENANYGPYATMFLFHPLIAVAIGSWTEALPPWTAYGAFVAVSLVLLAIGAGTLASQFEDRLLRAFTFFAVFCSLPTYLVLWNAQMHVFVVVAVAMVFAGLIGLARGEKDSARHLRMVQIGLLISLLSKPVALLLLPVLFTTRETRRALLLPVGTYAVISVFFLLMPGLNSGGYNGIHWLNLVNGSASQNPMYSLVYPREAQLLESAVIGPQIYCLPAFLQRIVGAPVPQMLLKIPVLVTLVVSVFPLFLASRPARIQVLMATIMLCLLSHFLCFNVVWEYHYSTLLPMLPVLWWMSQREEQTAPRWLLRIAFVVLLANYLPTLYFLAPESPAEYLTANTLLRVVPVAISFVSLLLYAVGKSWAALRAGSTESPLGQMSDLVRTGAILAISGGAVLASVYFSVPDRLRRPLREWTEAEWSTHYEDLLARPSPGLNPKIVALMHYRLGILYYAANPQLAMQHYDAALVLVHDNPELCCTIADQLYRHGRGDLATLVYQRVVEQFPGNPTATARLKEFQKESPP